MLHVLVTFMSAAASVPDPTTQPSRSARLLGLVRKLIDYGRELTATIRRRTVTDPNSVRACFGTTDIAQILSSIARGLHRANALEARVVRSAARLDAAPPGAASPRRPRTPAAAPAADAAVALVPAPGLDPGVDPVARRRPIGAVVADICRDLGIMPSDPLWREVQLVVIRHGGNLARLTMDVIRRAIHSATDTWPSGMVLTWPPSKWPFQPLPGTGPP
jgi:hypothetical protein